MSFATYTGSAWSCTVRLVVADERALRRAAEDLTTVLARVDRAASRFRSDSALSRANARAGRPVPVPALLVDLVDAALDAAATTDGAVDPTLGLAMQRIGYDRDIHLPGFGASRADVADTSGSPSGAWRRVRLHREAGLLTVPRGVALDLGSTAKAWTADHAARTLAARYDTAVLVELGGDVAVAGDRDDGWRIRVAEREGGPGRLVTMRHGGLTTSTTTVRTWRYGRTRMHHIVDPRTGQPTDGRWRTATVAAPSALAANTASTAAIVKGEGALAWIESNGLAARLIDQDGAVVTTSRWPAADHVFAADDRFDTRGAVISRENVIGTGVPA